LAAREAIRYKPDLNCIPEFLAQKHLSHERPGRFHISELTPASYLSFRLGTSQVRLDSYWKSSSHRPQLIGRNEKESQLAIESLLVKAIEERIPRDTPQAFALSGGIDSSLIVGLAHKYGLVRNAATYTLTYPNGLGGSGKTRDQIVARDVATLFETDHREVCVYPEQVLEQFPNIIRAIGQPFIGTMSMWFLARAVVQDFKVLISGDGADEHLGSYLTHRLAADVEQKWSLKSRLPDVDEELQIPVLASESNVAGENRPWIWASALFTADEAVNLLNADPKTVRDSYELAAMQVVTRYRHYRSSNPVMKSLLLSELDTKFPDQVLKYIDRLSMAHGLEVRCPFLDHQLSDLLLSFELNLRVRNGEFKWILKEVARTLLPAQVIDRPKEGFVSPFFLWRNEVLVPLARKFLSRRLVESVGVFKWSAVEPLVLRLIQTDTVTHFEANKVLALIATQIWTSEVIS